jgi:hypothetical protein
MRYERAPDLTCPSCIQSAALKSNAIILQRRIADAIPAPLPDDISAVLPPSSPNGATAWLLAISACLRRDVERHPACKACGILLGPGHLELGIDGHCGTCHNTKRSSTEPPATRRTYGSTAFGVRGWLRHPPARR